MTRNAHSDPLAELHDLATQLRDLGADLTNRIAARQQSGPVSELVTLARAAEILAVSKATVQEFVDRGELPVVELTSRAIRVDMRDIEARIKAVRRRR